MIGLKGDYRVYRPLLIVEDFEARLRTSFDGINHLQHFEQFWLEQDFSSYQFEPLNFNLRPLAVWQQDFDPSNLLKRPLKCPFFLVGLPDNDFDQIQISNLLFYSRSLNLVSIRDSRSFVSDLPTCNYNN